MEINTIDLERLSYAINQAVSGELMATVNIDEISEIISNAIIVRVRGYIWQECEPIERKEVKYPADWWQMLKFQHAPKWFIKRFPVLFTTEWIEVKCSYPDYKPNVPNQKSVLRVYRSNNGKYMN